MQQIRLRQDALPNDMRVLLDAYPREAWDAHPNFRQATRNWLGAHTMFCRLSKIVRRDTEHFLDGTLEAEDYAARLSYRGNFLVHCRQGYFGGSWNNVVPLGPLRPMPYPDAYENPELAV